MKCPACDNLLVVRTVGDLAVDVCKGGCGGLWFDNRELKKVDDADEAAGEALLDVERDPAVQVDHEAQWPCPKCSGIVMQRHFYSPRRQVEIDECGACGGVWLDAGELATIRRQFATEAERRAAAQAFFRSEFASVLKQMEAEQAEENERARRFARLVRFICPSYWIPGDQAWGAF